MRTPAPLLLLGLLATPACADDDPPRPNFLIVFTDDQGYGDLGCFGSTAHATPRLDRLAAEGTRYTNFYAQNVCGPSRSALLTGRYPMRSGGWGMPASEVTWAELLQSVGYRTACIGKWDVSDRQAIVERMPRAQGFDHYFGTLGANDDGQVAFHENDEPAGRTEDMGSLTTLYTDKAIEYLRDVRDEERPFALYVAHTMMHTDIDASERFRGTSQGGLYGDVVEEFDYETGRLLNALDELGLADDTLVLYTTDNGPWNQPAYTKNEKGHPPGEIFWGDSGPLRNGKGSCYEGGARVPCIVRWPGRVAAGAESQALFSTLDLLPTFASLAGFALPDDRTIDGVDQAALLLGTEPTGARRTFVYQAHTSRLDNTYAINGIRRGKWKLLRAEHHVPDYAREPEREEQIELYDLDADPGETTNLAGERPEVVVDLERALAEFERTARDD